jgi:hypothetical protein
MLVAEKMGMEAWKSEVRSPKAVGKRQLANENKQKAVGKRQLANENKQKAVGKRQLANEKKR